MPEVLVEARLAHGERELRTSLLLNSAAREAELLIPAKLAKKLRLRASEKVVVEFGGIRIKGDLGVAKVTLRDPKTRKERTSTLEAIVLPDKMLDVPLLGVVGQEKLRVIPRTTTGEPVFE